MKTLRLFCLLTISLIVIQSCTHKQTTEIGKSGEYKGYLNGMIKGDWECPDNTGMFPVIDIKSWDKVPVVNGRLPTYEETRNGTSLLYIDKKANPDCANAHPYNLSMPKLAYHTNPQTKKEEIVIVIQIVQFDAYRWVGYRYLTGGNGSSGFGNFRFLTDEEVRKAVE